MSEALVILDTLSVVNEAFVILDTLCGEWNLCYLDTLSFTIWDAFTVEWNFCYLDMLSLVSWAFILLDTLFFFVLFFLLCFSISVCFVCYVICLNHPEALIWSCKTVFCLKALNPETEFQFKNRTRWDSRVSWEEKFEGSSLGGVPASSTHKTSTGSPVRHNAVSAIEVNAWEWLQREGWW